MDLVDKIERTRFLGRELVVWLWWKSELYEGEFDIEGFGPCEVWLDNQLVLETHDDDGERSTLKGAAPSTSPEAKEALRQGKTPTKGRICIRKGDIDYGFTLDAETFNLSSVKLPALLKDEKEERFYERMYLVEELEALIVALYGEFLLLRLSKAWTRAIFPAITTWVQEEEDTMTRKEYAQTLGRVKAAKTRAEARAQEQAE